ncbi:putative toxin-antitoxin system toxin component, PIN family [Candidatus Beckwithbacteria bacterium CG22_combo_CG10-13_8_21_14_all_01_47_9]|uniref:Putative toxin-antitoxin system toxin component, PIN family n=1 Tax=Candidatus Beckwithbacteria bacterium CG22_combo_CG10-13_8_21_14_all_01_47_9 TaxID=1974496 RepID=A0A2H0E121_9BACT|nr:MAG: putative toxin-antitoxin system toxin component, PIN family [Candidatus Beckwithbacteria bacterium CG22_combo_CG10-13_8_21_14_all_01_47_9]
MNRSKPKPTFSGRTDASVILSGLASPTGGSGKLLLAADKNKLKLITTPLVINEVNRHLSKLKLTSKKLTDCLDKKLINLKNNPSIILIERCTKLTVDPDDAHVLAGAISCNCQYLITLDKKYLLNKQVKTHLKPILVLSPKEFWQALV